MNLIPQQHMTAAESSPQDSPAEGLPGGVPDQSPDERSLFGQPVALESPARQTIPFVFSSPHSGRLYPSSFVESSNLDPVTLRRSEDSFVEEIFGGVAALGAPLVHARFPRAYLDANREPYELDPAMFADPLPPHVNTRSLRVAGGLAPSRASSPIRPRSTARRFPMPRPSGAYGFFTCPFTKPCAICWKARTAPSAGLR